MKRDRDSNAFVATSFLGNTNAEAHYYWGEKQRKSFRYIEPADSILCVVQQTRRISRKHHGDDRLSRMINVILLTPSLYFAFCGRHKYQLVVALPLNSNIT